MVWKQQKKYENTFDLCLMDIEMPLLTGDEASILIRQITEYLPIIAVTTDSDFIQKYSEYGINACILKTFQIKTLYEKIIEFIK